MVRVRFTKSPTGRFGLAYSAGQEGLVTAELAKELVSEGYAEAVQPPPAPSEDAEDKKAEARETAVSRAPRRKRKS